MDLFNKKKIKQLQRSNDHFRRELEDREDRIEALREATRQLNRTLDLLRDELQETAYSLSDPKTILKVAEDIEWMPGWQIVNTDRGYTAKQVTKLQAIRVDYDEDNRDHPVMFYKIDGKWVPAYSLYSNEQEALFFLIHSGQKLKFSQALKDAVLNYKESIPF